MSPALREVAHALGRLIVVTFGAQGVWAFDGRPGGEDAFVPVVAVPVRGTTVGCGDAFVAGFLAAWRDGARRPARDRGRRGPRRGGDGVAPPAPRRGLRRRGAGCARARRRSGRIRGAR